MLILTRRINESILIGDDTRITILGTNGGQVKIGIDAPRDINIVREELLSKGNGESPVAHVGTERRR